MQLPRVDCFAAPLTSHAGAQLSLGFVKRAFRVNVRAEGFVIRMLHLLDGILEFGVRLVSWAGILRQGTISGSQLARPQEFRLLRQLIKGVVSAVRSLAHPFLFPQPLHDRPFHGLGHQSLRLIDLGQLPHRAPLLWESNDNPLSPASVRDRECESNAARAAEAMPGAPNDPAALTNASTAATPPTAIGDVAATVSDQVASHVLRLVSSGAREMVMRLHPPELGEVTVRVAVNGRDVSAWFGSPQLHVQTAIVGGIGQLQADLGNAGYNLNGAWVGAEASGSRQQAVNPPLARIPVAVSDPDPRMPATSRPSASGLNIYV